MHVMRFMRAERGAIVSEAPFSHFKPGAIGVADPLERPRNDLLFAPNRRNPRLVVEGTSIISKPKLLKLTLPMTSRLYTAASMMSRRANTMQCCDRIGDEQYNGMCRIWLHLGRWTKKIFSIGIYIDAHSLEAEWTWDGRAQS